MGAKFSSNGTRPLTYRFLIGTGSRVLQIQYPRRVAVTPGDILQPNFRRAMSGGRHTVPLNNHRLHTYTAATTRTSRDRQRSLLLLTQQLLPQQHRLQGSFDCGVLLSEHNP